MGIRLAGQPLILATKELCAWVEQRVPLDRGIPSPAPMWPGPTLASASVASPRATRPMPKPRLGSFYWPTGISRPAMGWFPCSSGLIGPIREAAGGDSGSTPITLEMWSDGLASAEVLSTDVTLLRVIPLTQFGVNDLVLLAVVDRRYFLQMTPMSDPGIPAHGTTGGPDWSALATQLAGDLGIDLDVPTIPAAYLQPDPSLNLAGAPAAMVLDSVAANIGMRVVAKYSGKFVLMNAQDSITARQADDASRPARSLVAGGDYFSG